MRQVSEIASVDDVFFYLEKKHPKKARAFWEMKEGRVRIGISPTNLADMADDMDMLSTTIDCLFLVEWLCSCVFRPNRIRKNCDWLCTRKHFPMCIPDRVVSRLFEVMAGKDFASISVPTEMEFEAMPDQAGLFADLVGIYEVRQFIANLITAWTGRRVLLARQKDGSVKIKMKTVRG